MVPPKHFTFFRPQPVYLVRDCVSCYISPSMKCEGKRMTMIVMVKNSAVILVRWSNITWTAQNSGAPQKQKQDSSRIVLKFNLKAVKFHNI